MCLLADLVVSAIEFILLAQGNYSHSRLWYVSISALNMMLTSKQIEYSDVEFTLFAKR